MIGASANLISPLGDISFDITRLLEETEKVISQFRRLQLSQRAYESTDSEMLSELRTWYNENVGIFKAIDDVVDAFTISDQTVTLDEPLTDLLQYTRTDDITVTFVASLYQYSASDISTVRWPSTAPISVAALESLTGLALPAFSVGISWVVLKLTYDTSEEWALIGFASGATDLQYVRESSGFSDINDSGLLASFFALTRAGLTNASGSITIDFDAIQLFPMLYGSVKSVQQLRDDAEDLLGIS
jgi:hypothetical protein